ncbi:uncharacterized protein LOC110747311 [Prunus avium]|uniref:Uncharacterized protein LOC110747311 n=1 Tax=Prunus avium TaxID=42229 RepID=A0A6P5RJN4_PRUAV|nr:uncharacterized protein LOC110747311 [Prunus avium]
MASSSPSSSSAGVLSFPNFSTLLSTKLSETNYLLWESQVQPYLIGKKFWRFIDGSHPCPPAVLIPTKDKAVDDAQDPVYSSFHSHQAVLAQVVGLTTSKAVWDCLRQNFSQQSLAIATHLKFQLLTITKGTKTVSEYLALAKSLSDQLAAKRAPVSSNDLVSYVIRGLGPNYAMLIIAIMQFPPLPTFADLHARLLAFDAQQSLTDLMASLPLPQAFYSTHSQHQRSSHPRGSRGTRHGSQFHRSGPPFGGSNRTTFSGSSQPHAIPLLPA